MIANDIQVWKIGNLAVSLRIKCNLEVNKID